MDKQTISGWIREKLASLCWMLFLRLNKITEKQYFSEIEEQFKFEIDQQPKGEKR